MAKVMPTYLKKAHPREAKDGRAVEETVRTMLAAIAAERDDAIRAYAAKLDNWDDKEFRVSMDSVRHAESVLSETFKEDFRAAKARVVAFAQRQLESISEFEAEIESGIRLGQKLIPVRTVGCYIPGGKYPLISAAIMSVSTARVAGVTDIVACAPPRNGEGIVPAQLFALHTAGADQIYALGGVQALGAMAYGCVGMPSVDFITGPGNAFVAEAKRQLYGRVGIDLPAGPTEIMVIADGSADAALVATDLLGQAEHGPDSPAWLITTSAELGEAVLTEVDRQLTTLPTASIASEAWRNLGEVVVVANREEAIELSDQYAPEHLELMTSDDQYYLDRLRNYGSLFVGAESTVAYGDKGVGTNHTLPTARAARYTGGLWVGKFIKTVTYQRLSSAASARIAPSMARICRAEGLLAHEITAEVRRTRFSIPSRSMSLT